MVPAAGIKVFHQMTTPGRREGEFTCTGGASTLSCFPDSGLRK